MKLINQLFSSTALSLSLLLAGQPARASSHMDAPLITLDPAANTTDVYAFRADIEGQPYLVTAVAVYPFEEPGIGPNRYNFDDNVRYDIHLALGDDLAKGKPTVSYQFQFKTRTKNTNTILQSYLGVVENVDDANQNLTQTYSVKKIDRRKRRSRRAEALGSGIVPPNNQGRLTPYYNQGNDGDQPAKEGVTARNELDRYTRQTIAELDGGYLAFAGQRDDGFYADIQSIFDLDFTFGGPNKPFDSQAGYNVHTIVLAIPVDEVGGSGQIAGVYATTHRRRVSILNQRFLVKGRVRRQDLTFGPFVQVGRQGNPLFNEALVAIADKDQYNRTDPSHDAELFSQYALSPELAGVLIPLLGLPSDLLNNRTDLAGIFIPDLIKVDLSTGPARLAGPSNDPGFSRLSVFGGDVLTSSVQAGLPGFPNGTIPGGWPNGRRFGDDVLDIAVTAVISDLRGDPLVINGPAGDRVDHNDITFNKVFPYAATPLNGRNHGHH